MNFTIKEFFGKEGLTSTSANHIANMAKELYSRLETEINHISAFTRKAKIIGTSEEMITRVGTSKEEFDKIQSKLEKIAQCKGFIAYLREAIKERDELYKEILHYKNLEGRAALIRPDLERTITVEEVMATWSIGDLIRYYSLEAKCAAFGKYIHEDGCFNTFRKNYYKILQNPIEIIGEGRDTLAVSNTPTISTDNIENSFFKLQEEYRNAQAELNGMKHSIDAAIEKDALDKQNTYRTEYEKYAVEMDKIVIQEEIDRKEALKEFQKLKITIPLKFKDIYAEISELAKS